MSPEQQRHVLAALAHLRIAHAEQSWRAVDAARAAIDRAQASREAPVYAGQQRLETDDQRELAI